MIYLIEAITLSVGAVIGFIIAAILLNNKIEESYTAGYKRGRLVSENSNK